MQWIQTHDFDPALLEGPGLGRTKGDPQPGIHRGPALGRTKGDPQPGMGGCVPCGGLGGGWWCRDNLTWEEVEAFTGENPHAGLAGRDRALGAAVDASVFCDTLIPGEGLVFDALRAGCRTWAAGKDAAGLCQALPEDLSQYAGRCRDAVAAVVGAVAGDGPQGPGRLIRDPPPGGAGDCAHVLPRDRDALAEIASYSLNITDSVYPGLMLDLLQWLSDERRQHPQVSIPHFNHFLSQRNLPWVGYYVGDLPSGARVFFYPSSISPPDDVQRATGVRVRDGDYIVGYQWLCETNRNAPEAGSTVSLTARQVDRSKASRLAQPFVCLDAAGIPCVPASVAFPPGFNPLPGQALPGEPPPPPPIPIPVAAAGKGKAEKETSILPWLIGGAAALKLAAALA